MVGRTVGYSLRNWLMQRVTAVVMAVYATFMAAFLLTHQPLRFADWSGLFGNPWMRLASLLALFCLYLHAWSGVSSILMDYVRSAAIRRSAEALVIFVLIAYAAWSVQILWGLQ